MQIADLNHLEIVEANVTGARGGSLKKFTQIDYIDVTAKTTFDLDGNSAVVSGSSNAFGGKTLTKIEFSTLTTPYSSSSNVFALSVTDD
jgi:hypothetical protein